MLKLGWAALFGNPLYTLLGLGAVVLLLSGYAGVKGYQFGADRQKVLCEVRVNAIKMQIDKANAEIKAINEKWRADFDKIEAERDAEARKAEEAEALANVAIGNYEDEISKRADKCIITDGDRLRLQ